VEQPVSEEVKPPLWLLPMGRLHPAWWLGVGAALIWADYHLGSTTEFPVLYVIPVALAAWYSGRWPALALAVVIPVIHGAFLVLMWHQPGDLFSVLGPTVFRGGVILVMALWFARLAEHERKVHTYMERLEGLLPICAFCKSIRNKNGEWETMETFISARSAAEFSHSFCKKCGKLHYPDFDYDGTGETVAVEKREPVRK
jgi:hypothetical protein